MALGRSHTVRAASFCLGALALAAPLRARADVSLVPARDGHLGAWLVSAPLTGARAKEEPTAVMPTAADASFRVLWAADGALDFDRALGTGKRAGAIALLGGELELEQDLRGWLLLSLDGGVRVFVDGRRVFARDVARLRSGSWDAVPLELGPGRHRIVLRLEHPGTWWAGELRLLDARDLLSPRGARWVLPGASKRDGERLARELLTSSLEENPSARGWAPAVKLEYRRGAPAGALGVRAKLGELELAAGAIVTGPRGVEPFELALPLMKADATRLDVEIVVGSARLRLGSSLDAEVVKLLSRSDGLDLSKRSLLDESVTRSTLEWLEAGVREGRTGAKAELRRVLDALESGRDPLAQPGVTSLARRSAVDGKADPLAVHVPASFAPGTQKRYPLVVALHGLNGTPERILEAFLDKKDRGPSVDGFVLAPYAHGNAMYRGPGELEVLSAIDWMLATYPIDPLRVSITGVSMGGTGTAHLGLRYTDRFAAAAPLCGYQSFFVRRDTSKRPLRPWETARMHHWSPASFAERGRDLPMWVAHGTKDYPLENSKVLVERYKELGYSMTDEWPDTGHDVWTKAYAGARLFPWLAKARLEPSPARVTLKTDSLRFGRRAWARITRLSKPGYMGLLDVQAKSPTALLGKSEDVSAFELERRAGRIAPSERVSLEIDGQTLAFEAAEPIACIRRDGAWQKGRVAGHGKRAGLEGPIRDAFLEPLVFVYGTLDPATRRANREVAVALARARNGEAEYAVLADRELDEPTEKSHAVFAVGTRRDHLLLSRIGKLPIQLEGSALVAGERRFDKPGTGAVFVQPNPRQPDRYLVVVTGTDAAGIWRALSLPQLLPDFVIYDEAVAPAAGEVVLGRDAKVKSAGFFDHEWGLPAPLPADL